MSSGLLFIDLFTRLPWAGRWMLTTYLRRSRRHVESRHWVLERLKARLTSTPQLKSVSIDYGLVLEVDWSTTIGREIYFHRSYEPELTDFLQRRLKPGMIVIDAGANVGELTLRAARAVGPRGRVLAIEPAPSVYSRLVSNVKRNRFEDRVTTILAAATNASGEATFYLGTGPDSLSSSLTMPSDYGGRSTRTRTVTLDEVAKQHGLNHVDVIKLDIEGAEYLALDGARELLASTHPPDIIFEYNSDVMRRCDVSANTVFGLLQEYGYTFAIVGERGECIACSPDHFCLPPPDKGNIKLDILATMKRSDDSRE